ncbi:DUF4199 domain-containing protein [Pontibacter arcticus]|uniref:DUF4199 domain-containing protein n=1 Tax=Pontibacter arcticus TaxID=2080288 RepID=A0A364RCL6_9BACT|nr:DUF4199 domain-containing protein [Pontibacter arcticus]RAU81995.1 hypothetical protein DP923_15055 [Pontibacter arcticus]
MEKIGLKYGVLTAAGLILYFLLMKLIGLSHIVELRFFNGLILAAGIILSIRTFKKVNNQKIGYFQGLGAGLITAVIATVLFAAFMLVLLKTGNNDLLQVLAADKYFGDQIEHTPGIVVFSVLLLEGIFSGAMISFIAMQYFKQRSYKVPNSP